MTKGRSPIRSGMTEEWEEWGQGKGQGKGQEKGREKGQKGREEKRGK